MLRAAKFSLPYSLLYGHRGELARPGEVGDGGDVAASRDVRVPGYGRGTH